MQYQLKRSLQVILPMLVFVLLTSCSTTKKYYENGNLEREGKLVKGTKVGEWKFYHSNGSLWQVGNFKDGEQDGEWKYFHKNGNREGIGTLTQGKKVGEWSWFHTNGEPYTKRKWKGGKLQEVIFTYDGMGNKLDKGSITNGTGSVKLYDLHGALIGTNKYKNGELVDY